MSLSNGFIQKHTHTRRFIHLVGCHSEASHERSGFNETGALSAARMKHQCSFDLLYHGIPCWIFLSSAALLSRCTNSISMSRLSCIACEGVKRNKHWRCRLVLPARRNRCAQCVSSAPSNSALWIKCAAQRLTAN